MNWHELGLSHDRNAFGGSIKIKQDAIKKTQIHRVADLISRLRGATSYEIIIGAGTVSPHARLSELKAQGWTITKRKVDGKNYHRYFGKKP